MNISLMQSLASGSKKHSVKQMDSICKEANKEAELWNAARTGLQWPEPSTNSHYCLWFCSQVHQSHLFHISPSLKVLKVPGEDFINREDETRANSGAWLKDNFLNSGTFAYSAPLYARAGPAQTMVLIKNHKQNENKEPEMKCEFQAPLQAVEEKNRLVLSKLPKSFLLPATSQRGLWIHPGMWIMDPPGI